MGKSAIVYRVLNRFLEDSDKKANLLGCGLIAMITLLVYTPALKAGFVWDDDRFLTENTIIHDDNGLYRFWLTTDAFDYFPVVSSMLWVEWRLWEMDATGYHVVNLFLHIVSSLLIWLILIRLKIPGAWLAALVFAIHPVNVESVAWITQRKNTLPMVFFLLSILCFLIYGDRKNKYWYIFSLLSFLLALLGKTSIVMLPFVLIGCLCWQNGHIPRSAILRVLPYFVLALILALVTIFFQYSINIGGDIVREDGMPSRLAIAGKAVWFYVCKALLPVNLSFVYPRWETGNVSVSAFIPAILLACLFGILLYFRNGWGKPMLFGLGYYVLNLFPVLGFFNIYYMRYSLVADHYQYHSIVGVIALICALGSCYVAGLTNARKAIAAALTIIVISGLCLQSWRQTGIYENEEILWQDTLAKNPNAWIAYMNMGVYLDRHNRIGEAISFYKQLIEKQPDNVQALTNLGIDCMQNRQFDDAQRYLLYAIRTDPVYADAYNGLGTLYGRQGRYELAIANYKKALEIDPEHRQAKKNFEIITRWKQSNN